MNTQIRKTVLCLVSLFALCNVTFAQMLDPVKWKQELKMVSDTEAILIFSTTIDEGWHLYTTNQPDGGPLPATISFDVLEGAELVGELTEVGEVHAGYDAMFEMVLCFFLRKGQFLQRLTIADPQNYKIEGLLEGQACCEGAYVPVESPFKFAEGVYK